MKSNYLNNLEREFYFVSDEEREQIIAEYEVHFEERIKDGATEAEVIANFGTAKSVAVEYATELGLNYSSREKFTSNLKRDSSIYMANIKRKLASIKNEEAAKRKNRKAVTVEEQNEQSNNSTTNHSTATTSRNIYNTLKNMIKSIARFFVQILYFVLTLCTYTWKLFVNFFVFIIGISFTLLALTTVVIGILLPFFMSFSTFALTIWLLIYGSIISISVFLGTISLLCLKRFGRNHYE